MSKYVAEFIGTFALILIGAGAVCVNGLTGGSVGLVGIALAHGLTIMTMVYALGHVSGGHFNPAVTTAMAVTRRIETKDAVAYIVAQLAGASTAAFLLSYWFPRASGAPIALGACALMSGISPTAGILLEGVLTFFLVTVIWGVAVDARGAKPAVGLAIGLTITLDILMGGPVTGAAMNPARAFGPALISGSWVNHVVYWIGPILGGILAALLYDGMFLKEPAKSRRS